MLNVNQLVLKKDVKICATSRYFVISDARITIAASYRISPSSIHHIIKDTIEAIWDVLMKKSFLEIPKNE